MRTSTFLMSIIVLVAIMCKNVVNGAIAEGGWMTYCQDKTKAPEGALFACFRSNDGGIHYNGRDLTSSVIYSNPSKANEIAVVLQGHGASAKFWTNDHTVQVYVKDGSSVNYSIKPRQGEGRVNSSVYSSSDADVVIGK